MTIQLLLHSSKTMRASSAHAPLGTPALLPQAIELADVWKHATSDQIRSSMKVSDKKAVEVMELYRAWTTVDAVQTPAIDAFIGDMYSGLQSQAWSGEDRSYAHKYLLILSGLYGGLRACDGIAPYRLEMGYKLPGGRNLYQFWGESIASLVPADTACIINLSAVEYTKALLPHLDLPVITPKFLTVSPKTGEPTFVTVHTKIARGAFVRWAVQNRIEDVAQLKDFADLGYHYDAAISTSEQPVFVCDKFDGLGLSVR